MKTWLLLLVVSPLGAGTVTFNDQIAPILYERCAGCHRAGQAAPFSLTSYEDAVKRGPLLATVTKSRYMPPWKAEPASYEYRESRRLTDDQIALIGEWVKQGMPLGNPEKAPAVPKYPDGWQLGTPDLVVELPEAVDVPAEGADLYRNLAIPLGLTEDKWVTAIEMHPTARKAVHHVLYFADTTGEASKLVAAHASSEDMPISRGTLPLGGWAVGTQPHFWPAGLALPLPKGSDLVFQYHFHPTGKAMKEKTTIGLFFAKSAPERKLLSIQLPVLFGVFAGIDIPPGAKTYSVHDSFVLPADVEGVSVAAHAHYLGKNMKLTATLPDGSVKTLLAINDWDFSWQDRYTFQDFISLPKGTRLDGEVTWDNSSSNPRNPSDPPVEVKWGEQSRDEMGSVSIQVVAKDEADYPVLRKALQGQVRVAAMERYKADPAYVQALVKKFGATGSALTGGER